MPRLASGIHHRYPALQDPTSSTSSSSTTTTSTTAVPVCSPKGATFTSSVLNIGGGEQVYAIEFKNAAQSACTIHGYPQLQFESLTGSGIPTQNDQGIGEGMLFEPVPFQELTADSTSTIDSNSWGGFYLVVNDRAEESCTTEPSVVQIGWDGTSDTATYPSNGGAITDVCSSESVQVSVTGSVDPSNPFLSQNPESTTTTTETPTTETPTTTS